MKQTCVASVLGVDRASKTILNQPHNMNLYCTRKILWSMFDLDHFEELCTLVPMIPLLFLLLVWLLRSSSLLNWRNLLAPHGLRPHTGALDIHPEQTFPMSSTSPTLDWRKFVALNIQGFVIDWLSGPNCVYLFIVCVLNFNKIYTLFGVNFFSKNPVGVRFWTFQRSGHADPFLSLLQNVPLVL